MFKNKKILLAGSLMIIGIGVGTYFIISGVNKSRGKK
jgi:hypothetical protein